MLLQQNTPTQHHFTLAHAGTVSSTLTNSMQTARYHKSLRTSRSIRRLQSLQRYATALLCCCNNDDCILFPCTLHERFACTLSTVLFLIRYRHSENLYQQVVCCLCCVLQLSAQGGGSAALTPPPEPEQPAQSLPKLPAVVQLINENYFSHRKRKVQDEDDIMVCHCPPPWRGGDGCGPNCINRMLCIECTEVGMRDEPAHSAPGTRTAAEWHSLSPMFPPSTGAAAGAASHTCWPQLP